MIAAWAHALTNAQIRNLLDQIPGLGVVLYPPNYQLALEYPAIAYVPLSAHAKSAREYPFRGFILGRDEPNAKGKPGTSGPSGPYMTPSHAKLQVDVNRRELQDAPGFTVPASLGTIGGFWRTLFKDRRFDDAYHRERGALGVAWAPNYVRKREVMRVLRGYGGVHVMSPALYQNWHRFFTPNAAWYASLSNHTTHIAIWSLQEAESQVGKFGLFTRDGSITRVGRDVQRALA